MACPFGYADMDNAVRGLLSTGLIDAAAAATDQGQVDREPAEALHPHQRRDGTVWMPNVFRYLIARTHRARYVAGGALPERDAHSDVREEAYGNSRQRMNFLNSSGSSKSCGC